MVETLEDAAAQWRTDDILARYKHAQSHTVEQNHRHTDPLKPRAGRLRQGCIVHDQFYQMFNSIGCLMIHLFDNLQLYAITTMWAKNALFYFCDNLVTTFVL